MREMASFDTLARLRELRGKGIKLDSERRTASTFRSGRYGFRTWKRARRNAKETV
jgi:hypothetical protein